MQANYENFRLQQRNTSLIVELLTETDRVDVFTVLLRFEPQHRY